MQVTRHDSTAASASAPAPGRFPIPADESSRLDALRRHAILDTGPEAAFDRITRLVQSVFDVPMVRITLVDAEREWFKSSIGCGGQEAGRDIAFCAHTILQDEILVVPNALEDPRFEWYPQVTGEEQIRFYAGAPLKSADGFVLGTLCVLDKVPRDFSPRDVAVLRDFAAIVSDEMELRLAATHLDREVAERRKMESTLRQTENALRESSRMQELIFNSISEGIHWIGRDGKIIFENPAAAHLLGWEIADLIGRPAHETMHHSHPDGSSFPKCDCPIYKCLRTGLPETIEDQVFWRQDGTSFARGLHHDAGPGPGWRHHGSRGGVLRFDATPRRGEGLARRQGSRRSSQSHQKQFPGEYEPRDSHPDERGHRNDQSLARYQADHRTARLHGNGARQRREPADGHQ